VYFHTQVVSTESALINLDNIFKNEKQSYEIIVIDDGSNRAAFQEE
jgi:tRNA A22 N-methylase